MSIKFECQKCGNCCKRQGIVFLTNNDLFNLCEFFKLDYEQLKAKYLNVFNNKLVLKDHKLGACIFFNYEKNICSIYEVRPEQCQKYPFWPEAILDKDWFINEQKKCLGIKL